ncbi:MAG: tetratricopeptide repeat protein [Candidatus Methanomethylophilaceae archaeon]
MMSMPDYDVPMTDLMAEGEEALERGDTYIARDIFEKLASDGDPEAMYRLGIICRDGGRGVVPDREEARRWFSRASKLGHTKAHESLLAMNSHSDYITVFTEKGYGGNYGGEMSRFRR